VCVSDAPYGMKLCHGTSHVFTEFWTVFKSTLIMSLIKTYISFF